MYGIPHKAVATPFAAYRGEVLNKVIHRAASERNCSVESKT